jgi:hypothetical protein
MFTPFAFQQPQLVTNGLVLYLDAADRTSYVSGSTTWRDLSPSSFTGSLTNGPTFSSGNGGSIVFDGINDYVAVSNFNYGRTGFTAEAWFKYNQSTTGYHSGILMKWQTGAGRNNEFSLFTEGASTNTPYWPGFGIQGDNDVLYSTQDTSFIQVTGSWYHQVGTFDGTYLRLYVNGTLRTTSAPTGTNTVKTYAVQPISVAAFGDGLSTGGTIISSPCNVGIAKIYNRALSSQEVLQNFNAQRQRFNI